ncbi:MAG TPA: aldo/keto reductase [Gemmatimonadaceae bacterium]
MKLGRLGTTGASVSRVCLGCMTFGSSEWRPWTIGEREARPIFRKAIESGINFFDTADMYSLGMSEEITGRALRDMARLEEIVIATKVFWPMTPAPNMGGLSRKHIVQACEASLRRLGVERIDLYQIHRLDHATPMEETLAALDHLVTTGKVLYIGASSMHAWQFARMLSASEQNGWARFVTMQNHYNLLYREEEREMNPLCLATGVGLLPWSPLARGFLAGGRKSLDDRESSQRARTDEYGHRLYKRAEDWTIVETLNGVARERGEHPAAVALAWLLSKPAVTAPVLGVSKPEQLDAAFRAVELELSAEEIARLESPYGPHAVTGHD